MAFKRVKQPKLADVIEAELEKRILEGSLVPGQRLPAERELAKQFDVSRPSLREAVQKLEAKGLLLRRQGGGTYVSEQLAENITAPLFELLNNHPESQFDLLEFRHALEGISAYYAAMRGTSADAELLQQALDKVEQSTCDRATTVMAFNICVAEASHNVVLLQLMHALTPLLKQNIQQNFTLFAKLPAATVGKDNALTETEIIAHIHQHKRKLVEAIQARKPDVAQAAAYAHLAYIEEVLLAISQQNSRLQRTLRRGMSSTT